MAMDQTPHHRPQREKSAKLQEENPYGWRDQNIDA